MSRIGQVFVLTMVPVALLSLDLQQAPAHPTPGAIRTAAGCKSRIARLPKRKRCLACIARGKHHFHKAGAAAGFCHRNGAPVPAAAAPAAVAIRTAAGCQRRIARLPERKRCVECVKSGRVFQRQAGGEGFCRAAPGPGAAAVAVAATAIRTAEGCRKRIVRLPKRKRCVACVSKPDHVFQKQGAGAGFCRKKGAASVAATVAATAVRTADGCRKRILVPEKRRRCLACVGKGHVFQKQGGGAGFCRAPGAQPAGTAILTAAGCKTRIARIPKRQRCIACVSKPGHVFMKQGAGLGFCKRKK
jgi:hypothetical protein